MYYKSPEIAPLAQPANPLEATTGEATTGAGAAPTGGAPAGTAMPIEDLAGAVARGAAGAAATGAARTGTASAAPALVRVRRPARVPRPPLARRLPTSPPRSRRAPAGAGVEDGGHPRVSSVRVGVCSLLWSLAIRRPAVGRGGGWVGGGAYGAVGGRLGLSAGGGYVSGHHTTQKVRTWLSAFCCPHRWNAIRSGSTSLSSAVVPRPLTLRLSPRQASPPACTPSTRMPAASRA